MVNKQYAGIAAAVVVVIVAAFFIAGGTSLFAAKAGNNTINAAVTKDCAGTPWFVGQEKGFFKNGGVNFVDKGEIAWAQQPAALISGQINVYDGHPNALINLLKSGAKVKGVAIGDAEPLNSSLENPKEAEHMHWLVKENSELKTAQDVKTFKEKNGRKVKIAVGSTGICADLETNAYFRKNNVSKDDYEFVILADPQQEQALQQGLIDVATLHPPFYKKAEKDGGVRVFFTSTDAFGPAAGVTLVVFTDDYIKNYPGTVRDFVNAFKEAERWTDDNRNEAGEITAKNIGLPFTSNVHWYSKSGAIDDKVKGYLQQWIDAMVADGQLQPGEYKPEDLYTTEFSDTWKTNLPDQ